MGISWVGFLVQKGGIEIDRNKAKEIMDVMPPGNKKKLQRFIGAAKASSGLSFPTATGRYIHLLHC